MYPGRTPLGVSRSNAVVPAIAADAPLACSNSEDPLLDRRLGINENPPRDYPSDPTSRNRYPTFQIVSTKRWSGSSTFDRRRRICTSTVRVPPR